MTTENWWMKKPSKNNLIIFFTIMRIITTFLLVRVLFMLYDVKTELNIIKSNSWNAYDTADANYQKLRVVWNDVENILNQVSK